MVLDVEDYLRGKGCAIKKASQYEINTSCFFCGEDEGKRGRLYINTDPSKDPYALFDCKLCGHQGAMNAILKWFGDPTIKPGDSEPKMSPTKRNVYRMAADYYYANLADQENVYDYLRNVRGLELDTIESKMIGYADGGLRAYLESKGVTPTDMIETGLVKQNGKDFLTDSITIPYFVDGNIVQIRGKEIGAKYKTPPGNKAFPYNVDAVRGAEDVIICEGEFDALVLSQMGYTAIGVPGANTWQDSWTDYLKDVPRVTICFDPDEAGMAGAEKLSTKLGGRAKIIELPQDAEGNDVTEWIVEYGHSKDDFDLVLRKSKGGLLISVREAYERWLEVEGNPDLAGLKFGMTKLDEAIKPGLLPGQVMVTLAKSQPVTSLLPTPNGMLEIGSLVPGDNVFGVDGTPTEVVDVYDRGVLDTYRVSFTDNTYLDVGLDHIWRVAYRYGHSRDWKWVNRTTEELIAGGLRKNREYKYIIPMCEPVQYEEKDLPIDPYTLGALIANGGMTNGSVVLTTPDDDVVERVRKHHTANAHKVFECPHYGMVGLIKPIRELGLDCYSHEKFIPQEYLTSSVSQRVALLEGLMDGDGGNRIRDSRKAVAYYTSSRRLADDVIELVNSLGGTGVASWLKRAGRREECNISIMMPSHLNGFSTPRKDQERPTAYNTVARRAIKSIEMIGSDEHRCIRVAASNSLYLASPNYHVTHNTGAGKTISMLNFFHRMKREQPDRKFLFVSLEQTSNEWFERARRIHRFYEPSSQVFDTVNFWEQNFMMIDKNRVTEEELVNCIHQYVMEMGEKPDLVAIDYLGYFANSFRGDKYAQVSAAIMACKAIGKEFQLPVYTPVQVSRLTDAGAEPELGAARDSGVIEETADFVFALWADDQKKGVDATERTGEVKLKILKSRHGGVGTKVDMLFTPKTLAMIPENDPLHYKAAEEIRLVRIGDDLDTVVYRNLTGWAGTILTPEIQAEIAQLKKDGLM